MKIDDRVESLTRDAIDAAVKRDPAKLDAALKAFRDGGTVRRGIELACAVIGFVLVDVHGGKPSAAQIRAVAEKLVEMEAWAQPTADEVNTFIVRLINGQAFGDDVPPENVVILTFVIAANLLASFRPEGTRWFEYLDRAEAAVEAASR